MSSDTFASAIHFFVSPHGRGWHVAIDRATPVAFLDRESAIKAALQGAASICERFQTRTSVKIQDEHGWRVLRSFCALRTARAGGKIDSVESRGTPCPPRTS